MEENTHYIVAKSYRKLLPWAFLSTLLVSLTMPIGSSLIASFLGPEKMAISVLSFPLWSLSNIFFTGIGYGASLLFGQYMGENQKEKASCLVNDAVLLGALSGLILGSVGWFLSGSITNAMGTTPLLYAAANQYNKWLSIGLALSIPSSTLYFFINANSRPGMALIGSALKMGLFILFSYLFMKVWGKGLLGSAYALIVAEGISLLFFLQQLYRRKEGFRFHFKIPNQANLKHIGGCLLNFSIDNVAAIVGALILNRLILHSFSTETASIYFMLLAINEIVWTLFGAVTYAMMPLTSTFFGEKNSAGIRETLRIGGKTEGFFCLSLVLLFLILSPWIPEFYNFEVEDHALIFQQALFFFALSFPCTMSINVVINFLLSINKLKLGLIMGLLTLLCPLFIGLIAVWTRNSILLWAQFSATGLIPLILFGTYLLLKRKWISFDRFLGFNASNQKSEMLCFLIRPEEMHILVDYQEMVRLFLEKHDVEEQRIRHSILAIGEVMEYAIATNQRKNAYVDIRLALIKPTNQAHIMVKLDNDIFEPSKEKEMRLLSLELLRKLSQEFKYNRILSFNTLDLII